LATLKAREKEMLAKPPTKEGGGTGTRIVAIPKISEDSESEVDLALRADAHSAVHPSDLDNDCMPETLLILTKFCTMMHGNVLGLCEQTL
jgi:hypothetical protein